MQRLTAFLERHLETLALAGCALCVLGLSLGYDAARGATVVLFCSLAFYYLASGLLVLLDRHRVERVMRLTWFLGLWGLSLTVLGLMATLLAWDSAELTLLAGITTCAAVLGFVLLQRQGLGGELREAYHREIRPLALRLLGGGAIAVAAGSLLGGI